MRGRNLTAATHCWRGHEFSGRNVREHTLNGQLRRICLACKRQYAADRAREIKGAKLGPTMDRAQLRRLLDAHRDGVSGEDLCDRFGLSETTLKARLEEARMETTQEAAP